MSLENFQLEILQELKKLSIDQASIRSQLESHVQQVDKISDILNDYRLKMDEIAKHGLIIRGIVWVMGLLITVFIYRNFPFIK